MKGSCITLLVLTLAAVGCSRSSSNTQAPAEAKSPAGAINFINTDLQQVLQIYGQLAGAEMVVEPGVKLPPALITLSNQQPVTRTEALSLIEVALRERYGISVEHQDAKHFTVKPAK
jgi:type II secretory pathway component GspD/PulD (secretin)